jgi:hypothetical protein
MDVLLIVPTLLVIFAGAALARREWTVAVPVAVTEEVVVDLEFLRSRPAELDQRISDLVTASGRRTLGARMRSVQIAQEALPPSTTVVARTRRRSRPLVASR